MVNPSTLAALPTSGLAGRVGSSAIRDLLALTERPDVISLAGGLPAPEGFPVSAIAEAAAAALADDGPAALQYGPTEGYAPLRAWVADRHPAGADIDQVLLTHGSQQAIELVARAVVGPGATIALADPAYVGALQAFRAADAHLVGIPSDGDGMRVDVLADRLAAGLRPALVYVVPDFDNPTGATLSDERRVALAELADRYGFLVLDDGPYTELRWSGRPGVPLARLTDRVVSLGTASKVLAPGLRVGWAVGPAPLLRELTVLKQSADLHTSSLGQRIVHRVLSAPGFLDHHLAGLRVRYQRQADALLTALHGLDVVPPAGGMFLWARLPGVDTTALLAEAVDRGVAFVPGAAFSVDEPHVDAMRLSFATAEPDELVEAARRLLG